jgi:hypothetical protein
VSRTPRANPAAAVINNRMACGITTVAKSTWVATGSRFWTTMIATTMARNEAVASLKFRILSGGQDSLSKTPLFEGGDRPFPPNIWINDELKHPNATEFNLVIFELAGGTAGTEIPLLLK